MTEPRGPSILFELFRAGQRARVLLTDAMADCGLRPDEYAVYSVLVDGGPSSPTRMADAAGMPPTTMSHYVRAMLERGHVARTRRPEDGRSAVLSLTRSGRAAHRRAAAAFEGANGRFLRELREPPAAVRRALESVADAADAAAADLGRAARRQAG